MKFSALVTVTFVVHAATVSTAVEKACIGEVLTFNCNVSRNGTTVWSGTAFHCSSSNDEIAFTNEGFTNKSCSDGEYSIVAQAVSVADFIYTSELNFTANSPSSSGEEVTIQCGHDNGAVTDAIATYTIQIRNCNSSSTGDTEEPSVDMQGIDNIMESW